MYLFSGSAAGPLLTLSTTHRGAEAPRIHDANVRSTAHDDDGSQTAEARKRGAHVLTRGGARPIGPGRWGERHGGHKRRDAVVPLVIARSLAPSRASRAPPAPPRATRHSRNLCASVPRCVGIVCGKPFSRPRPILTTGLMTRSGVRAPLTTPIRGLCFRGHKSDPVNRYLPTSNFQLPRNQVALGVGSWRLGKVWFRGREPSRTPRVIVAVSP